MGLSCWFADATTPQCNIGLCATASWIYQLEPDGCIAPRWSQWFVRVLQGKVRVSPFSGHSACFAEVEVAQTAGKITHVHRLGLHRLPLLPTGYIDPARLSDYIRNLLTLRLQCDETDAELTDRERWLCGVLEVQPKETTGEQLPDTAARVLAYRWAPTRAQIERLCQLVNERGGQALLSPARFKSEFPMLNVT